MSWFRDFKDDTVEVLRALVGEPPRRNPFGIMAQFDGPAQLLDAARAMRRAGYRRYETYSPFPIHGMDRTMGLWPSWVPPIVFGGGVTGLLIGLGLQTWIHVVDYPLAISGKPHFSLPAFIPPAFETTVLLAAFAAVGGMLVLNLLPRLYHPDFKHSRFAQVSDDGFFLAVSARDHRFDPDATGELLESLGGTHIELLEP